MPKAAAILFILSMTVPGIAHAKDGLYAGGLLTRTKVTVDDIGTVQPTVLSVRLGAALNPYVSLEARIGTGIVKDQFVFNGTAVDVNFDSMMGAYAKGIWPIFENFSAYGLLGYTEATQRLTGPGGSFTISDVHFTYGAGLALKLFDKAAVEIEYARLYKGSDYKVDGLSVGAALKF